LKEHEAKVEAGHKLVLYVEKEDHHYGPVVTGSYMAENYIDDFMEKRETLQRKCQDRVTKGEISPVAYYMTLLGMGEGDLATRAGITRYRLRRHLTPKGFARIPLRKLQRYAEIFAIPVANLFQIIQADDTIAITHEETPSPFVVLTRATRETS
jgi:hypothetical protein